MKRPSSAALPAIIFFAGIASAQTPSTSPAGASWMRYPSISPDGKTIAFTFKGDIYRVSSAGGTAIPLTSHTANDFMPVWSHDGKQIAFASDRYGNYDIYVINADGGEAKRLTFHSADEFPTSFSADDRSILFSSARQDAASNRQFPTAALPELYEVPGGRRSSDAGAHDAGRKREAEQEWPAPDLRGQEGSGESMAQTPCVGGGA